MFEYILRSPQSFSYPTTYEYANGTTCTCTAIELSHGNGVKIGTGALPNDIEITVTYIDDAYTSAF